MHTIGTRVTSGVIGSVKGSWEPGQTNERMKNQDEETVITTCSAKTVKWSNVSQRSMATRRPNGDNLYSSIEAFVRDRNRGGLLPILIRVSVNDVVELARSVIRPSIVEDLSDEELIQRVSETVRDASQMAAEAVSIPIVARAGSGEDSGISSLRTHQNEGNYALELENRSVGTFAVDPAAQPAEDDVLAAKLLLAVETVSTSSSGCQNPQVNSSRGESHATATATTSRGPNC
jgi:hypothetical protein